MSRIGDYRPKRLLSSGPRADEYLVADPAIPDTDWALRIYKQREWFDADKSLLLTLARGNAPAIPRVKDYFDQDLAIVVSHSDGRTAKEAGQQAWRKVVTVMQQVAEALEHLHASGYLHLGITPETVILGNDSRAYLHDFAFTQPIGTARFPTGSGPWSPPERAAPGVRPGPPADAYGVGILALHLLGAAPSQARDEFPWVPDTLEQLIRRLLSPNPNERATFGELRKFSSVEAEREMTRCPKCGLEQRRLRETCAGANCGARFRAATAPAPDFSRTRRELPPTQVARHDDRANGEILRELQSPVASRALVGRALRLTAEAIDRIPSFETLLAPTAVKHLIPTVYEHQMKAVGKALGVMRGNAILADEVGLGKTIEAGLVIKELALRKMIRRALIVVPRHLLDQWAAEMSEKFDLEFTVYGPASTGIGWRANYLIAPIGAFNQRANYEKIADLNEPFDLVVVDEMHNLLKKNGEPKLAYQHLAAMKRSYTLLLSATPIRKSVVELYHLVNLVRPGSFPGGVQSFLRRFDAGNHGRATIRGEIAHAMIRNLRSDLKSKNLLKERHVERVPVTPSAAEAELLRRCEWEVRGHGRADPARLAKMLGSVASQAELLGLGSHPGGSNKTAALIKLLAQHGDRAVVFAQHDTTCRYLAHELRSAGFTVKQIDGKIGRKAVAEAYYAFKHTDRAILVATDVAAEGRNLQFAHLLVNYDLPLNPLRLEQRIGRIDRIGQTETPKIRNLVWVDTFEDQVHRVFADGLQMFTLIVGELASVLDELEDDHDDAGASLENRLTQHWFAEADHRRRSNAIGTLNHRLSAALAKYQQQKSASVNEELF